MGRGPLVAVCVVGGMAAGVLTAATPHAALWAALGAALAGIAGHLVARGRSHRFVVAAGLATLACLSAAHAAQAREAALAPPLRSWFDAAAGSNDRPDDPTVVAGRLAADATPGEFGVGLLIDVHQVWDAGVWLPFGGLVQANLTGDLGGEATEVLTEGRFVRAPVLLRRPRVWLNPGGPSERWQALRRGISLTGTIKSAVLIDIVPGAWWHEGAAAVRRHVRRAADTHLGPLGDQTAAIVTAILIGDRAGLDDDVALRLQAAGTYHVIAISGGNVALVTALCLLVLRVVVRSARASALATIAVVVAYGWVVGGDASVTRAVTAAVVYLGVGLAGLAPRPVSVVALVAVMVSMADPLVVVDVGAWLSFGATLAIVVAVGPLTRRFNVARAWPRGVPRRLVFALTAVASATAAAELALLPVTALVFARVGVAGLLVNLVAVPAMAVIQLAGAATVACAGWWSAGADAAARLAHVAAIVLLDSARLVDVAPVLSWRVPPASMAWVIAYYAAWAVWLRSSARPARRRGAIAMVVLAGAAVALVPPWMAGPPPGGQLRVTALDVGQGDALLVQFPGGRSMLVDTGGAGPVFDIGRRVVVPASWALGVRRLEWLVVTHADGDHIGGALGVVSDLRPREIWEGIPVESNPDRGALRATARARGIVWRQLQAGHAIEVDGVTIDVRHPRPPDWERPRVRNDDSLVLRLVFGQVEVLLTGDAASEYEDQFAADDSRRLRVLKVAHHGSRTSTSAEFVRRYRPDVAVVSAGRSNLFGHPAPDVLARLLAAHAEVYRTDLDGAVEITTDGRSIQIETATGRRRVMTMWR